MKRIITLDDLRERCVIDRELMMRIAKESHSFPHFISCQTCCDDYLDVRNRVIEEVRVMLMERVRLLTRIYESWQAEKGCPDFNEGFESKIQELLRIAGKERKV